MSLSLAVETDRLKKSFGGTEIICSCNMHVKAGTIYGFLGENGAGKTTVFKMLSGILRSTAGNIKIFGLDVATQRTEVLAQIGTLIETPVFYEHLSATENLKLHLSYMGAAGLAPQTALEMVGLADTRKRAVSKFSLGMRQRLAIARAISHQPLKKRPCLNCKSGIPLDWKNTLWKNGRNIRMIKLFGLELRRNPIKKYLLTIFAVAAFLLGLTYLFAYIPHKNSNIAIEMAIVNAIAPVFSNYRSIAALTSILSMVCFAVFSATIFNQFIIHDFTGKRFYLLLSYPIKKSSIFLAKVIAAIAVSALAMLLCNALVFAIFYNVEAVFPMVTGDTLSIGVFYDTGKLSLLFSVISTAIGIISMRVGFIKKSSHIALITSFACSVMLSNLLGVSLLADFDAALLGFTMFAVVLSVIAVVLTVGLTHQVNQMEGE